MRKHIYTIISLTAMLLLASCVKDRLYLLPEDDPDYFNALFAFTDKYMPE